MNFTFKLAHRLARLRAPAALLALAAASCTNEPQGPPDAIKPPVANLEVTSTPCVTSSNSWVNTAFATQTGTFTAQFDATPGAAAIDGMTGLSPGTVAARTDLAALVRFRAGGTIEARNGGAWAAATTIPYGAGRTYHLRLVVDVPHRTYSAYVTPAGGSEQTIGSGYAFRSEQSGATSLGNWGALTSTWSMTLCNFSLTPGSGTTAPVASVTLSPSTASVVVGSTVRLIATLKDANGNPVSGPVVWSSSSASVASVSSSGLVRGVAAGTATITASSAGKSGSGTVTVTAPPPPSGSFVLVGAGDIASCGSSGDEATANLLDKIAGTIFTAGDNAYPNGSTSDYSNCYQPSWGRHKSRTRPAPGNHEYNTAGAAPYFAYFGANAGPSGRGYYSYDLGAWHIISLNSNILMTASSPQVTWLKADLAASTKRCTLAYWHLPRFSSGQSHSFPVVIELWNALYAAGAELVISAHDHTYERFAPQTPNGIADPTNGIREFVVGTGGASPYGIVSRIENSQVRNGGTFGVLKLTLSSGSYSWQFIPVAGQTFTDSGSGTCH